MRNLKSAVDDHGFALAERLLTPDRIDAFLEEFDREFRCPAREANAAGRRQLLSASAAVRKLIFEKAVADIIHDCLGAPAYAVNAILFDKHSAANWKVPWHQDLTIAVRERREVVGFGPWTVKEGVQHVQSPASVLQAMLTLRIHLDDASADNGPLRVVPGSHLAGRLASDRIGDMPKELIHTCEAARGDALLMKPLILHASSCATRPRHRRILHVEFSSLAAPAPLEWHEKIQLDGSPPDGESMPA